MKICGYDMCYDKIMIYGDDLRSGYMMIMCGDDTWSMGNLYDVLICDDDMRSGEPSRTQESAGERRGGRRARESAG